MAKANGSEDENSRNCSRRSVGQWMKIRVAVSEGHQTARSSVGQNSLSWFYLKLLNNNRNNKRKREETKKRRSTRTTTTAITPVVNTLLPAKVVSKMRRENSIGLLETDCNHLMSYGGT